MLNTRNGIHENDDTPFAEVLHVWESSRRTLEPYLAPIRSEDQYRQSVALVRTLWDILAREGSSSPFESLFDLVTEHIKNYENEHYLIPDAPPHAVLAEAMAQKGVSQLHLGSQTGISQSTISKLLRGDRAFTSDHVKRFSAYFKIDPAAFL
jgi:HTH-type transcriptional regulator/antitoxin HigA